MSLEALAVSTGVVALGEVGDKTQLLALLLAARFKRPLPIIAGIFVATLANHALASALGGWVATTIDPQWLRWALGISFLAIGVWMLVPDQLDNTAAAGTAALGVFGITTVSFFLAEMGDKTQIATVMLGARYPSALALVATGTTLGMLVANVPAVYFGERVMRVVPARTVHRVAAIVFAALGIAVLLGWNL